MNEVKEFNVDRDDLEFLYGVLDWVDFALVGAIIWYYGRKMNDISSLLPNGESFNMMMLYQDVSAMGLGLLLASLLITTVFIWLTVIQRRKRFIGPVRAVGRMIWNIIWIVVDIALLVIVLPQFIVGLFS